MSLENIKVVRKRNRNIPSTNSASVQRQLSPPLPTTSTSMGALKWTTKGEDEDFLRQRIPGYAEARASGRARAKNVEKAAFLLRVLLDYQKAWPGRYEKMSLPNVGTTGNPAERQRVFIDRLDNWFTNQLRAVAPAAGTGRRGLLDVAGTSRHEQTINAYYRLFRERLQPELNAAYRDHLAGSLVTATPSTPIAAFRNRWLSDSFNRESATVQDAVRAQRLGPKKDRIPTPKWRDEDVCSVEELGRRAIAHELQVNISKSFRTIDKVTDMIWKATGWNVVFVMGGPDPARGGDIHIKAFTKGSTAETEEDTGDLFQDYCTRWDDMIQSFEDFCKETTSKANRKLLSLANVKSAGEPVAIAEPAINSYRSTAVLTDTSEEVPWEMPTGSGFIMESGDHTSAQSADSPDSPITSATPAKPVDAVALSSNIDPAILDDSDINVRTLKFNGTSTNYWVPHSGSNLSIGQVKENQRCKEAALNRLSATDNTSELASLPKPGALTVSSVTAPLPPTLTPAPTPNPVSQSTITKTSPLGHQDDNLPRQTRSLRESLRRGPASEKQSSIPPAGQWTVDAAVYLADALKIHNGLEVARLFQEFEKCLGYPNTKAKANKLDADGRPEAVRAWLNSGRDFAKTPAMARPCSQLIDDTYSWLRNLLPVSLKARIPAHGQKSPVKSAAEWSEIRKGSTLGFFTVLMAVSWMPEVATTPDDHHRTEIIINDIIWILREMTHLGDGGIEGKENRKRKGVTGEGAGVRQKKAKV